MSIFSKLFDGYIEWYARAAAKLTDQQATFAAEAARGTPAIAGATATAVTLNQWVAIGTGIYIIIQVVYLLRKWYREEKDYGRGRRR
jgi:hypothetical protein